MLDPRIYRAGMIPMLLALIVIGFSLRNQQGPATTSLVPDAFNGAGVLAAETALARGYPERAPGSAGDDALAGQVSEQLGNLGFTVSRRVELAATPEGERRLVSVAAIRPGLLPSSIVVVAHRDDPAGGLAGISATAGLLELARVLSGQTLRHQLVLISDSGSSGAAGTARIAAQLPGPVDAALVLGNLDARRVHGPVLTGFSSSPVFAPPRLRNTVAAALAAESAPLPRSPSLGAELTHLALPFATTEEAPFNTRGVPAVEISLTEPGARGQATAPGPVAQLTAIGRGVLRAVNAVDSAAAMPAPSSFLLIRGKLLPAWALRLLVLAALLPVLAVSADGAARAARRGFSVPRWLGVLALRALAPAAAFAVVVLAGRIGFLHAPPQAVRGPAADQGLRSWVGLLLALGVGTGVALGIRRLVALPRPRPGRGHLPASPEAGPGPPEDTAGVGWRNPGAGAGILLALCLGTLALWQSNPFAALLVVPALHLWIWALDPDLDPPRAVRATLLLAGCLPAALLAWEFARGLGAGPLQTVWSGLLLIAGGGVGFGRLLIFSLLLSAVAGAAASVGARATVRERRSLVGGSVRGPAGYAGPGSLGGTESAMRR